MRIISFCRTGGNNNFEYSSQAAAPESLGQSSKKKNTALIAGVIGGAVALFAIVLILVLVFTLGEKDDYDIKYEDSDITTKTEQTTDYKELDENTNKKGDKNDSENDKSVSYKWTDGVIIVNGKEVKLPCTVKEFINITGLKLDDYYEKLELYSKDDEDIDVIDGALSLYLINDSEEDINVLDATVAGFAYQVCEGTPDVVLKSRIKLGMSSNEIKVLLGEPDKEYDVDSSLEYVYWISQEDDTGLHLLFENNSLIFVSFSLLPEPEYDY